MGRKGLNASSSCSSSVCQQHQDSLLTQLADPFNLPSNRRLCPAETGADRKMGSGGGGECAAAGIGDSTTPATDGALTPRSPLGTSCNSDRVPLLGRNSGGDRTYYTARSDAQGRTSAELGSFLMMDEEVGTQPQQSMDSLVKSPPEMQLAGEHHVSGQQTFCSR